LFVHLTESKIAFLYLFSNELELEPEQIGSLAEYLPSREEISALQRYSREGEIASLSECERWMLCCSDVDSPREKLEALQFMAEWPSLADGLKSGEFISWPVLLNVSEHARCRC